MINKKEKLICYLRKNSVTDRGSEREMKKAIFGVVSIVMVSMLLGLSVGYSDSVIDYKAVALKFLEQVVGINTNGVGINTNGYTIDSFDVRGTPVQPSSHMQTDLQMNLESESEKLGVTLTLLDGRFWGYKLDTSTSDFNWTKPNLFDCLDMVNYTAVRLQEYLNASWSSQFVQTASTALSSQKLQLEDENSLLTVVYENSTPAMEYWVNWFGKVNGQVVNDKSIYLGISSSGMVTELIDNMDTYTVATASARVSEEEAVSIAMPYITAYATRNQQQIFAVNASLEYVPDNDCNRSDMFSLYPQWNVYADYKTTNKESVYGYQVFIWADTGEVYSSVPQGAYSHEQGTTPVQQPTIPVAAFVVPSIVFIGLLFGLSVYKQRRPRVRRKN